MDWKKVAAEDLQNHIGRKKALCQLEERIALLSERLKAGTTARLDGMPGPNEGYRTDGMVEMIAERERLRLNRALTARMVALVERGLDGLEQEQKQVLEGLYINGKGRSINATQLGEKLCMDRATVYRLRDEALRRFTLEMYGMTEL